MQSITDRLRTLIGDEAEHVMSIRSFADAMRNRKPRPAGSTRAMIHRYLKGTATPPLDFLTAAAAVLKVRVEWLTFGHGHPSRAHEVGALGTARGQPTVVDEVDEALRTGFAAIAREEQGPGITAAWHAWSRFYDWEAKRDGRGGNPVTVAQRVGEALEAPLRVLGIRHRDLSPWQLDAYAVLVSQAIQAATVDARLVRPQPQLAAPERRGRKARTRTKGR